MFGVSPVFFSLFVTSRPTCLLRRSPTYIHIHIYIHIYIYIYIYIHIYIYTRTGALSIGGSVVSVSFPLFNFFSYATTPMVARALARDDPNEASRLVAQVSYEYLRILYRSLLHNSPIKEAIFCKRDL